MLQTTTSSSSSKPGQIILDELISLQKNPATEVNSIVDWFGNNLNTLHLAFTGRTGDPISKMHSHGANIITINEKPYVAVYAMYMYENNSIVQPLDISEIASKIPSIEVKQGSDNKVSLDLELYLNLNEWLNLVPSLVYEKTQYALASPGDFHEGKSASLEEAKILLSYFYPAITENDLVLAQDLGMLERADLFKTLLDKKTNDNAVSSLPSDISY